MEWIVGLIVSIFFKALDKYVVYNIAVIILYYLILVYYISLKPHSFLPLLNPILFDNSQHLS